LRAGPCCWPPAAICLLAGLDGAFLLLDLPAPVRLDRLPEVHGMLMVFGFVGTLVALERAVALGASWAFAAPLDADQAVQAVERA
jgi:hypothetical protein